MKEGSHTLIHAPSFFMGKEITSQALSGGVLWNMTFKHQCEQLVQSVTGVLDVNVNQFHVCFLSTMSSQHNTPCEQKKYILYNNINNRL